MIVGTAGHIDHGKTTLVRALTGVDTDRLPEEKKRGISIELGYAYLEVGRSGGAGLEGDGPGATRRGWGRLDEAGVPPPGVEAEAEAARVDRIGFIDVPGHERLVHTMLAGATGIDFALLLVAADDGVMPQTREHLAVLSLLGIARGAVVITKIDRADAARVTAVANEAEALLAGTPLAGAPVLALSATRGEGVDALRALLFDEARRTRVPGQGPADVGGESGRASCLDLSCDDSHCDSSGDSTAASDAASNRAFHPASARESVRAPDRRAADAAARPDRGTDSNLAFRLAVDRAFTLAGVGTVATGTVHAGQLRVGDEVVCVPGDPMRRMRVRSIHAQNRDALEATGGQRCALALAGVPKEDVPRGSWLVAPAAALATSRLDVELSVWPGESRALRSGSGVHVHIGAADVLGSIAVLDGGRDALVPGARGRVQLVLQVPIAAWHGDRVVLRDASATRTLAGGRVLDPHAPTRYRRTPERLAALDAASMVAPAGRLQGWLEAAPLGVDVLRWQRSEGLKEVPALPTDALQARAAGVHEALAATHARGIEGATMAALHRFHAAQPEEPGPDAGRLRRLVAPRLSPALWRALLIGLQARGSVATQGAFVQLPDQAVRLSASEMRIAQKVAPLLAAGGFDPPWVRDLARDTREPEALLRSTLARLAQRGELHQVVRDLYYPVATVERLAALARELAAHAGEVRAAAFRDRTGLGRKRAIQVLEYFDRIGLLRKVADVHRLRGDSSLFLRPTDALARSA